MKKIVVIGDAGVGKTTFIESVSPYKLNWNTIDATEKLSVSTAILSVNDISIEVTELPEISKEKNKSDWPKIAELIQIADLIVRVRDSSIKTVMNDTDDMLLDYDLESKVEEGLLVFSKMDLEPEYESLKGKVSEEFYNGYVKDWNLCFALTLLSYDNERTFTFDMYSQKDIGRIRNKILEIVSTA